MEIGENKMEIEINNKSEQKSYITEGSARILNEGNVFYNPVQQFNRDLSLSVITTFSKIYQEELLAKNIKKNKEQDTTPIELKAGEKHEAGIVILEALSATGLRSIRYAKEIPGIKQIIANDLSKQAVDAINENIKNNEVENLVESRMEDATTLMYTSARQFNVIDLDPYGCPTRFLDGAVQSLSDGGLLLVTATDMAVLAGNTPEVCYVKYGSIPLKTKACHEMALRILLRSIEGAATKYGRHIVPLLSISADFYIRVFVRIYTSPKACMKSSSKQSMIFQCTGCDTINLQPLGTVKCLNEQNPKSVKFVRPQGPSVNSNCEHCGHRHHMGGPIWSHYLHDEVFVDKLIETIQQEPYSKLVTHARILGMLSVITEELHDVPLYYTIDKLCSILKLEVIPILKIRSALLHANYKVSFSHANKASIKTNAPPSVLWDILRCWAKTHPVKKERFLEGSALKTILSKEPTVEYNLVDIHPDANPDSRRNALARFPQNPAAHWGPGTRATIMIGEKMLKSVKNQNKNQGKRSLTREEYLEKKKLSKNA